MTFVREDVANSACWPAALTTTNARHLLNQSQAILARLKRSLRIDDIPEALRSWRYVDCIFLFARGSVTDRFSDLARASQSAAGTTT